MKKLLYVLVILGLVAFVAYRVKLFFGPTPTFIEQIELLDVELEDIEVIAENLKIPWELEFLPDGAILVTERPGTLLKISEDRTIIPIEGVEHVGEGGLLGLVFHPDFEENSWIYLYLTTKTEGRLTNRVERYRLGDDWLFDRTVILENIPGAIYHDGGRLAFGPDGLLYITTGDARNGDFAQDTNLLAGKILRLNDDGSIPDDNPFGNAVYAYGLRNSQGLAWDEEGNLWAIDHGRSGVLSGLDELNLIERGKNYGWPVIQGNEEKQGMETPVIQSGPGETWAPADAVYLDGKIFFTGLRGESLYVAGVSGGKVVSFVAFFREEFGRLRALAVGPDGNIYLTTSNTDDRGDPKNGDDKLIRIDSGIF